MGKRAETKAARSAERSPEERRKRIREMVGELPDHELQRVEWIVRAILEDDPVLWSLGTAAEDDEDETEAEQRAIAEAEEDVREGRLRTHDEVWERLLPGE